MSIINSRSILSCLILLLLASCGTKKQFVVSFHKGYPQYESEPWVRNVSKPFAVTNGLTNKHIAVAQSHGRYYNNKKGAWDWQRPFMNGTREDLFTRTIVVPYLIPMLENAGANVFTPRERDEQTEEIIVNKKAEMKADKKGLSTIHFVPTIRKAGRYAVYVSYPKNKKNIPDALYTVWHGGTRTSFTVNQRMGQGTWVYLGTFDFEAGESARNSVTLSSLSRSKGVATATAVRFGGGMGSIARGGTVSGEPRCLEAARYTAQWYGAPDSVWNRFKGENDYNDDINARPRMVNWLAGGSCFNPNEGGLNVPIELFLSVHSDAGKTKDDSYIGTLAICTTNHNNGKLGSGASRNLSKELATNLQKNINSDITNKFSRWNTRGVWDKNYGETRIPQVPSAIIEVLSHENPADMKRGHDPEFRFTLARSIYKTILRFLADRHGGKPIVQPLPPKDLTVFRLENGNLQVQWAAQPDPTEPSSAPTAYIVYISTGTGDYDNGTIIHGNAISLTPQPNTSYRFKVTAINAGGESLPAETSL